jgi:hypothetical protein
MARANFSAGFEKPAQLHCAMPKNLSQKHIASFVYRGFPIRPLYQQILIGKASFQIDEAISDSLWLVKQGMLPPVLPRGKTQNQRSWNLCNRRAMLQFAVHGCYSTSWRRLNSICEDAGFSLVDCLASHRRWTRSTAVFPPMGPAFGLHTPLCMLCCD